jgi:hypothetical protein
MNGKTAVMENLGTYEKKYKKYFDVFEKYSTKAKANKKVDEWDLAVLGAQLDQFENWKSFKEANGSADDLGVLPKIALDVITAANASSVIPLFASVQPINERKGLVWFKNIVSTTTRGNIKAGQTLLSATQGRVGLPEGFAGEIIADEVEATGDGSATDFTFVVKYAPVRVRTVTIVVDGQETKLVDDGIGNLIGVGGKGKINYETGEVNVSFDTAPASGAAIKATYATNLEELNELQTIQTQFDSTEITARTFALRTEIGLFKSYEMQKRFNINPEEVLAQDLVTELTTNISTDVVRKLYQSTPGALTWDRKAPDGIGYMEHLLSFTATLAEAENKILEQSGRIGNEIVYVVGTSVAGIMRAMTGFKPATDVKATLGTHFYGTLDGRPVVRSTVLPADEMIVVSKGDDPFTAAVVYAPYMPLFVTDTFHGMDHNPLNAQKAAAAMAGSKAVVPTLATRIKILNA